MVHKIIWMLEISGEKKSVLVLQTLREEKAFMRGLIFIWLKQDKTQTGKIEHSLLKLRESVSDM